MSQTPVPTRPGEPHDPQLRERYLRDAQQVRRDRRAETARLAAEVPPSRTPSGPIRVVAGLLTLVLVLGVGFLLAGPMLKQTSTSEQALPADITSLEVDNDIGDVRIRTADAGEAPRVTTTTAWGLRRPDVLVEVTGATASLDAQCPSGIAAPCSTDWTVVVPAGVDVEIEEGVGRVMIEGIDGDVDVEAGVGDVRITEATAGRITAELGVGSLWVEAVEPPQHVYAKVGVGDLSVQLPETASYDVDVRGGVGEVRNDLGSDAGSDRTVTVEGGLGSVSLSAS
ncbi:hypothetical protein [Janibacter cremeus]|uniref:Adhesin domain-containing protein n=1 Tax=Janibacter cremeus TaxID=1285192 RepID=A0A852VM01_9MICO|nr:hypothetical protein [Janibacter cremeus]NYF98107.1 hypothetical protein [Janibacter cremeus]